MRTDHSWKQKGADALKRVWGRSPGRAAGLAALAALALFSAGCRKDMHDQPKYRPLAASTFFEDGQSARMLVAGTIARGTLHTDDVLYTGVDPETNQPALTMPVEIDEALLERGRERYNIFCTPCHGATGEGNGMIVRRGFPAPPSFHVDRLRQSPDGHYFNVITNGFGRMYEYGTRVPVEDRWAIIAYIRALQLSQNAMLDDLPEEGRQQLMGTAQ